MPQITLTVAQMKSIKKSMDEKTEMLKDEEIKALAEKVNSAINLPILDEGKEFHIFVKIIRWIDKTLYKFLPNEYYVMIRDSSDGISKEEASRIEERLTPMVNNVINIPILTEKQEEKLISLALGLIINAMIKGFKLEEKALD